MVDLVQQLQQEVTQFGVNDSGLAGGDSKNQQSKIDNLKLALKATGQAPSTEQDLSVSRANDGRGAD